MKYIKCPNLKALTLKSPLIERQKVAEQRILTFASSEVYRDCTAWPGWTAARRKDSHTKKRATTHPGSRAAGSVVLVCELTALWHVGSSQSKDWTCVPCIGGWIPNLWPTKKPHLWISELLISYSPKCICIHKINTCAFTVIHRPAHVPTWREMGQLSAFLFNVWQDKRPSHGITPRFSPVCTFCWDFAAQCEPRHTQFSAEGLPRAPRPKRAWRCLMEKMHAVYTFAQLWVKGLLVMSSMQMNQQ